MQLHGAVDSSVACTGDGTAVPVTTLDAALSVSDTYHDGLLIAAMKLDIEGSGASRPENTCHG